MRRYRYVGPPEIAAGIGNAPAGMPIRNMGDIAAWIAETRQAADAEGIVVATFIIDESGALRIADRRSEHVACAGGKPVRSAGEMHIDVSGRGLSIAAFTNQSTGYCPEPESWPAVAMAIGHAKLSYCGPGRFDPAFEFRRCPACRAIAIVKEHVFQCSPCGSELPVSWNFAAE